MSTARELSEGRGRRKGSRPSVAAAGLDLAALRRMTRADRPDLDTFAAVLGRVGELHRRMGVEPGPDLIAARARYEALTGAS